MIVLVSLESKCPDKGLDNELNMMTVLPPKAQQSNHNINSQSTCMVCNTLYAATVAYLEVMVKIMLYPIE